METLDARQSEDVKVLVQFIAEYCRCHHEERQPATLPAEVVWRKKLPLLCAECQGLLDYAVMKRRKCPLDPKPSCKKCHIHCYGKDYRARIREVMAFSGKKLIMKGRLDLLWHYFIG